MLLLPTLLLVSYTVLSSEYSYQSRLLVSPLFGLSFYHTMTVRQTQCLYKYCRSVEFTVGLVDRIADIDAVDIML